MVTELACPGLGGPSVGLGPLRVGESMRERVLGSMRERVLGVSAVWPSVSGRMAFGIWPCGLWTLAAWRGLICARCPCPNGALWWLASARTKRPTMGFSLIGALPGLGQRRQGGRECAVRYLGCGMLLGSGATGLEAVPVSPWPYNIPPEVRSAAGAVKVIGLPSRWTSGESRTLRGWVKASSSGGGAAAPRS